MALSSGGRSGYEEEFLGIFFTDGFYSYFWSSSEISATIAPNYGDGINPALFSECIAIRKENFLSVV